MLKRSSVTCQPFRGAIRAVFTTAILIGSLLGFTFAVGCNTSGKYPVRGKVTDKQGQPIPGLEGSQIVFEGGSTSSVGEIAADGSFTMFTDKPGDGVPPGEYQVYIPRRRIDPEREAPQSINARFEKPQTSDLKATVEPKNNTIDFQVDRAGSTSSSRERK